MSKLKLVFFVFVALFVGNNVYAQNQNDVTLIVSADDDSKEEATKVALRSAIEQAYGTFVSANTTILNDELVKDEIVTVASGNIKEYKEIACEQMPNGKTFVTLQATVSISHLVSYAQSKGAETEFAGAAFAMNMKMQELNKQNEMKALQNLLCQVKELLPISFDKKLIIKDPLMTNQEHFYYNVLGFDSIWDTDKTSFSKALATDYDDQKGFVCNENIQRLADNWIKSADESYLMEMEIQFIKNNNTSKLFDLISSTLSSLSLTDEAVIDYHQVNTVGCELEVFFEINDYFTGVYYLRNSEKDIMTWGRELQKAFYAEYDNYKIIDNNNQISCFNGLEMIEKIINTPSSHSINNLDGKVFIQTVGSAASADYVTKGSGLLVPFFLLNYIPLFYMKEPDDRLEICNFKWTIKFLLPKSDISKYTNFRLEPKS